MLGCIASIPSLPARASLKTLIVFLNLPHHCIYLILTLKLHPLNKILLELTRIERILFIIVILSAFFIIFGIYLFYHHLHEILVRVMY